MSRGCGRSAALRRNDSSCLGRGYMRDMRQCRDNFKEITL